MDSPLIFIIQMNSNPQPQDQGISIQELQEDLGIFEVRLDEKLKELTQNFSNQHYELDVNKSYYDHFSNFDAQFKQNMNDLTQFLIKDQLASTPTLRSTFYKVLENPLFCLFKSSKFELFELCLNGFDIEYQPDEAIKEVHKALLKNTQDLKSVLSKGFQPNIAQLQLKIFPSPDALLFYSYLKSIQFKIFTLYSYIRKGAQFLKKEYEHRLYIAEMFASIQKQLIPILVSLKLVEPLRELTTLNFQIVSIEPTYDYFFFFFSIPPKKQFLEVYQSISLMAEKCEKNRNYNPFVIFALKHHKELNLFLSKKEIDPEYTPLIISLVNGAIRLLRAEVGLYEEFVSVLESLLNLSKKHYEILENFLTFKPQEEKEQLVAIRQHWKQDVLNKKLPFLFTLRELTFEQVKQRLEKAQQKYLFSLTFPDIDNTRLRGMLELIGGVPQKFFDYVEKDFKAWNPTTAITGKYKYIESQFTKSQEVVNPLQNLKTINNFLHVSGIFPKEYDDLLESKLNARFFFDLLQYLLKSESLHKALGLQLQFFILNALGLYVSTKNHKEFLRIEDKVRYLSVFANASFLIHTANNQLTYISTLSKQIEELKYDLSTKQYIGLLTTIAISLPNTKEQCMRSMLGCFTDLDDWNQKVKANRFHEQNTFTLMESSISKEESKIIKEKYSVLNNKLISHDLGLFKFSTQDISTNPLNFESRIDDILISLTPNAKKIIQVLLLEIVNEIAQLQTQGIQTSPKLEFLLEIVKSLCHQYPIVVPYVVSLKIPTKLIRDVAQNQEIKTLLSDSITFGEFLCQAELICKANKVIPELIISLLKEKSIKYLNGKDYVKHEIAPTISEALVKIVNHQRSSKTLKDQIPKILSLLVLSLQTQDKLQREQVETVKGLLLVLRQQMSIATDASRMLELSTVYKNCIKLFFKYKGNELNKPLLESTYSKYGNAQIQNYDVSDKLTVPVIAIEKLKNQTLLNFAVNLDFDLQNSKLIRTEAKTHSPALYDIHFKDILQDIKAGTDEVKNHAQDHVQKELNVIDLNGSKYNLLYHLGEQRLNTICSRTECQFKLSANKIYPEKQLTNEQQELRNIVAFYSKQVFVPTLSDSVLQGAVISLLKGGNQLDFLRNPNNFDRVSGLLTLLLVKDYSTVGTWGNSEVIEFIKGLGLDTDKTKHEDFVNRILNIFSQIGYSNFWVYSFGDLSKRQLKATQIILSAGTPTPTTQSLLSLILTFTLESYVSKRFSDYSKFSHFIKSYFSGRPEQNQVLTYKVTVNKNLLNLILKCIDFQHLNYVSILFYSNFQNLRLYTDDLQEGFKALNLASKTRAYNQFIRLSNEYNDIEYLNPLRIFKQNLKFFTKIEKEGYLFKVDQEAAITVERIINQVKSPTTPQLIDAILDQYFLEVNKLKANTINRVKSIYLSSKLRDLSLQNGTTIALLYEVLKRLNTPPATITEQINKVELFSILCSIHYDLLSFQSAYNNLNKYANYSYIDNRSITEDIVFSTTKRFGFNMNQNLNQLELELDEVIQSALTNAKPFFVSDLGQEWIEHITINPALPTYNRVRIEKSRTNLILNIQQLLVSNHQHPAVVTLREELLCEDLVRELSSVPSANFLKKDGLLIQLGGARVTLDSLADKVISQALKKQILLKIDQSYIINKNKFSQDSLDVLKALGFIISYCIFWKIQLNLPLHHSIICQICSCIVNLDDLLSIDFKTWEYLRMVLSEADSKTLNLNFSYEFDSLTDPNKKQKIQLIDKGVQKKVNNLNREEYVDFICCRILFGSVKLQLQRLLTGVFKVLPKQYIANLKFKDVLQIFYKIQNKQLTNKLAFESLKKFGIILPETYTSKDSSFQNLKDYVNINWLMDSLQELSPEKYLRFSQALGCKEPEFLNLSIYTRTGATESLQLLPNNTVIINHFKSKEGLKAALAAKL